MKVMMILRLSIVNNGISHVSGYLFKCFLRALMVRKVFVVNLLLFQVVKERIYKEPFPLEEYENLVPNIVNTNKEVASRVTEVNHRIIRLKQQQDSSFEKKKEASINNLVEQINQQKQESHLHMNMTQQLSSDTRIIMHQQQCLNARLQSLMVTNNASGVSQPQPSAVPVSPISYPAPPFPFPFPKPPTPLPVQLPVSISPAPPSFNCRVTTIRMICN